MRMQGTQERTERGRRENT